MVINCNAMPTTTTTDWRRSTNGPHDDDGYTAYDDGYTAYNVYSK